MPPKRKPRRRKNIAKKEVPPRPSEEKEEPKNAPKTPEKKKVRAPRKKVTLESHLGKIDELLKLLDNEIERKSKEREKGVRTFQGIRKTVRELRKDVPKIANGKRRIKTTGKRTSGFMVKHPITEECANFLQMEKGTLLSRREVTNAICVYAHYDPGDDRDQMKKWAYLNPKGERNLQQEGNKMVIIPDETLTKLLLYKDYQDQVKKGKIKKRSKNKETGEFVEETQKDPSLFYWVIQKRIGRLFEKP